MIKLFVGKPICFILFVSSVLYFASCKEDWDKHYSESLPATTNLRITDYIKSQPELSTFYKMLVISGYDTILNSAQSYTVWAPDSIALLDVDLNDIDKVKDIVKNHITHFLYPTSGIMSQYIKMLNGKYVQFENENGNFLFGNNPIKSANVLVNNGIIHVLGNYVPFNNNILQYIYRTPGLDSLKNYIQSQTARVFYPDLSIEVGVDSLGNSVYDSVFIESNMVLDNIGRLDSEDSVYTAILPNNAAWTEAYNRIMPFFVSANPVQKNLIQRKYTQLAIVNDIVFRNRIFNPASYDSLVSTTFNVFRQPAYLFSGSNYSEVSNGLVYVTNQLLAKPTDVWFNEIRVEAENQSGRTSSNANVYLRYSFGSPLPVSQKGYIQVDPTTTSTISKVYVDFSIPYTLAAKYNIYCVFVPNTIVNANDTSVFRTSFYLTYLKSNNTIADRQPLALAKITNKLDTTKMLIAKNFVFPVCDYPLNSKSYNPSVKLRVQNDVSDKEDKTIPKKFSRAMRIDCIILEPVVE